MSDFVLARVAPLVGETFDLPDAPGVTWTLTEVNGFGTVADPATHQSFSLIFRGAPAPVFAQQTVTLRHPTLGERAIFITPVAADAEGVSYEAVFN